MLQVALALMSLDLASPSRAGVSQWTSGWPLQYSPTGALIGVIENQQESLYAGANGAVLRSTDEGSSWVATGAFSSQTVWSLAASGGAGQTLLAGTVDGIYKSVDSGATWAASNSGLNTPLIWTPRLAFDAASTSSFYLGVGNRLYKSTDGGDSWTATAYSRPQESITAVAIASTSPPTILAASALNPGGMTSSSGTIERSTDGGLTWEIDRTDISFTAQFAFAPSSPSTVYAGEGMCVSPRNGGCGHGAVLRSTDAGHTWTSSTELIGGSLVNAIAVDFFNPDLLYVGAGASLESTVGGAFQSADGGTTIVPIGLNDRAVLGIALGSGGRRLHAVADRVWDFEIGPLPPCRADGSTLCLNGGRFQVRAQWVDFQGNTGSASVVPGVSSSDSGLMWFFGPENWELLFKVLNGCGVNGHYWVFGAAATNVEYTIQVTDTQTGEVKTYTNPLGTTSTAITDTGAFASCP